MIRSKSPKYSCFQICNVDDLLIEIKLTPQQDTKSNNVAQDDELYNAALRGKNQKGKKNTKKKLDICETQLFRLKEMRKKIHRNTFRSKITFFF